MALQNSPTLIQFYSSGSTTLFENYYTPNTNIYNYLNFSNFTNIRFHKLHKIFFLCMTVHRSSVWIKRPTRCHFLVLCLFLLYSLLNMFRATLCPSSGADDFEVFIRYVAAVTMGSVEQTIKDK